MCVCVCVCVYTVLFCCVGGKDGIGRGWGGGGGRWGGSLECVFVCVCLRQSSPTVCPLSRDGLFVRHRHKIIRLVVVCL